MEPQDPEPGASRTGGLHPAGSGRDRMDATTTLTLTAGTKKLAPNHLQRLGLFSVEIGEKSKPVFEIP